jgi:hypothetical protein
MCNKTNDSLMSKHGAVCPVILTPLLLRVVVHLESKYYIVNIYRVLSLPGKCCLLLPFG